MCSDSLEISRFGVGGSRTARPACVCMRIRSRGSVPRAGSAGSSCGPVGGVDLPKRQQWKIGTGATRPCDVLIAMFLVSLLGASIALPRTARGESILYGINIVADELVSFDIGTGMITSIGPLGFPGAIGLAFDSDLGTLLGSDLVLDGLLNVDDSTGAAAAIGTSGFSPYDIAYDPINGVLYGTDPFADVLFTIDPETGVGALVGATGFPAITGLAVDPFSGTIFGADSQTNQLVTIDPTTGAATLVGANGFDSNILGLAFDPDTGILYGSEADSVSSLLTIDTSTGAASFVGPTGTQNAITGLAFVVVPEPSTLSLVTLGVVGIVFIARRGTRG